MAFTVQPAVEIAAPEPDLTPARMIARAAGMRQLLKDDQAAAEDRGFYSEEIHQAFTDAGFYRVLQPRRFGGYEFDMATYYRLAVEVAHGGSAGAAWCLDLGTHHSIILAAHWPEQAQREIFTEQNGHFVCGHRAGMGGTAQRVEGGYRVSGRWRYSSGIPYSTHHMVGDAAKRDAPLSRYYRDISMYRLHASSRARFLAPQLAAVHFGLTDTVLPAGPG
jgi:3-hydroxy-9,10-secoandrosta-1,3,5(10)-triene-9,17-dione monooxygenase